MSESVSNLVFDDKARVGAWVAERVGQTAPWGGYYAMGVETKGELSCGVVFNNMNDANAFCHVAIDRPTKLLPELLAHAYQYLFVQQSLRRATALVDATNLRSLRLCQRLGFSPEATLRSAGTGGQDLQVLVFWPEHTPPGGSDG